MSMVITINPVAILANVQKNSAGHTLTDVVNQISIQMTDSTGTGTPAVGSNWLTTVGNITHWGLQNSKDGGATWNWGPTDQVSLPFGALGRGGKMPLLSINNVLVGNVTAVTNVANPVVTTDTIHNLTPGQRISIRQVVGATGINGVWYVGTTPTGSTFTVVDANGNPPAAPGTYTSGGQVYAGGLVQDINDQLRLSVLADTNITLGAIVTVN